jgi:hypothetical protein
VCLAAKDTAVPVTITGCVNAGAASNTFVLTRVEEVSAAQTRPADSIYWLSTTKGLKEHVGHKISVTGTFSPERDAGKTGKLKIESNPTTGEEKVVLENGMKRVELKSEPGAVGTSGVKAEIERPYRRLEVQTIKMIASSCP